MGIAVPTATDAAADPGPDAATDPGRRRRAARGAFVILAGLLLTLGLTTLPASAATTNGVRLTTVLTWQQSKSTGSDHGFGFASVVVKTDSVCFGVRWTNIDMVMMAHIHVGPPGVDGPIVVPLFVNGPGPHAAPGTAWGCVSADPTVTAAIIANPAAYYVNVHTAQFPAGAIRGQLSAAS